MTYHLMCLFICNYIIICYNYNGGRMKKIAINIFICLYVLLTILITYCLLSYNDYNIAELKNKTLLIFENKENNYKKSDLLIVKKNSDITKGEQIFYYDKYDNPVKVSLGKVVNIEKIQEETAVRKKRARHQKQTQIEETTEEGGTEDEQEERTTKRS